MNVVPMSPPDPEPSDWEMFWQIYPRKVARKDAKKAWDRLPPADQRAALLGIAKWRRVYLERGLDYCPHASTYLNGERWTDELPPEYRVTHASHAPTKPTVPVERGVLPESVKILFARLTAGKQT